MSFTGPDMEAIHRTPSLPLRAKVHAQPILRIWGMTLLAVSLSTFGTKRVLRETMWYGVLAAAGTPQPLVMKLHGAVNRALRTPDLNERLLAEGSEPSGILPDEFSAFIKSELTRWAPVIRASGARPD